MPKTILQEVFAAPCPEFEAFRELRSQLHKDHALIDAIPAHVEKLRQEVLDKAAEFHASYSLDSFLSWSSSRAQFDQIDKCAVEFINSSADLKRACLADNDGCEVMAHAARRVHESLLEKIAAIDAAEDSFLKEHGLVKKGPNAAITELSILAQSYSVAAGVLLNEHFTRKTAAWLEYKALFSDLI